MPTPATQTLSELSASRQTLLDTPEDVAWAWEVHVNKGTNAPAWCVGMILFGNEDCPTCLHLFDAAGLADYRVGPVFQIDLLRNL